MWVFTASSSTYCSGDAEVGSHDSRPEPDKQTPLPLHTRAVVFPADTDDGQDFRTIGQSREQPAEVHPAPPSHASASSPYSHAPLPQSAGHTVTTVGELLSCSHSDKEHTTRFLT